MIEIYTDGACKGNPGKGAWAAIIIKETQMFSCNNLMCDHMFLPVSRRHG